MRYARDTQVSADRSLTEIKRIVERYGANSFMFGTTEAMGHMGVIGFALDGKVVRIKLKLPSPEQFRVTDKGRARSEGAARAAMEQATKQRWRALALVVKAKLEAVECGISTIEDEFLSFILVDGTHTIGDVLKKGLEEKYFGANAPRLLPEWTTGGSP